MIMKSIYPQNSPATVLVIKDDRSLQMIESQIAEIKDNFEFIPFAKNTSLSELIRLIPDKNGDWVSPLALIVSKHDTKMGIKNLCSEMQSFLNEKMTSFPCDILSISADIHDDYIWLKTFIRYYEFAPDIVQFYDRINESAIKEEVSFVTGDIVIPDEIKDIFFTEREIKEHKDAIENQNKIYENSSFDEPFLNSIDTYTRQNLDNVSPHTELIYDLRSKYSQMNTILPYEKFNQIFESIMKNYVSGTEFNAYILALRDKKEKDSFLSNLDYYINREYIEKKILPVEDKSALMKKLNRALFELYIIQDLIDDPKVSDIKITGPHEIRARIGGKAYLSNISFIDMADYYRFLRMLAVKTKLNLSAATRILSYQDDDRYMIRLFYCANYISSTGIPLLHLRKISRVKLKSCELASPEINMMTPKVSNYILDCAQMSKGVVFAGPPGSGKTVALNTFLEEGYENSAEILCIQESDELFAIRKGVMFFHINPYPEEDEEEIDLEQLGQRALVCGVNVFIIGEAKGSEMESAIRLNNAGVRTALTIHSDSAEDTYDKMANLACINNPAGRDQAKRDVCSFDTIIYMRDFAVQEITKCVGFDEEKHKPILKYIYRRDLDEEIKERAKNKKVG